MNQIDFKCPLCDLVLVHEGRSYVCQNRHNFDEATEGYVNLLPVQDKSSKQPGDNEEMARSRQEFLNKGYYQPLASRVAQLIGGRAVILDAGCGEGYYLEQIHKEFKTKPTLLGVDISKAMVRRAGKRKIGAQLAVGSNYKLPLFDGSVDAVISVFAPVGSSEIARVLKPGGLFVMVGPGALHLAELVTQIFGSAVPHKGNYHALTDAALILKQEEELKSHLTVAGEDIGNLLAMTPYGWHAAAEQKERLIKFESLDVTTHYVIRTYCRA